jgi:Tol biopolymer transport system component
MWLAALGLALSPSHELVTLQRQRGLTLISVEDRAIRMVDFSRRSVVAATPLPAGAGMGAISRDGSEVAFATVGMINSLGVWRVGENEVHRYPDIQGVEKICWSNDKSKLVVAVRAGQYSHPQTKVTLVEVASGESTEIDGSGSITSQCWSPDDKEIVYGAGAGLIIYNVASRKSHTVGNGCCATWSPDGTRIAVLIDETYYAIDPSNGEYRKLFRKWHTQSPLWWSPDSHYVAYVSQAGLLEGGLSLDVESFLLRVRRLEGGSETKIYGGYGASQYQWVESQTLRMKDSK